MTTLHCTRCKHCKRIDKNTVFCKEHETFIKLGNQINCDKHINKEEINGMTFNNIIYNLELIKGEFPLTTNEGKAIDYAIKILSINDEFYAIS